jgi:protein ImuB
LIVCVLIPRFELAVAAGGREALAAAPVGLAPEAGRAPLIGEASAAAEALGVRAGLRLGEALARCPTLRLVTPDPAGVADEWDRRLAALEGIGAAVEPGRPGLAWFDAQGLRNLHGDPLALRVLVQAPQHDVHGGEYVLLWRS